MWGKLQAFKVGRVVRNRTFIHNGLTMTWFFRHPTLKACNSPCIQYYFKRFFVLHSSKVIFSFLIKKSRQKATEIEIAFSIPLGIPKIAHWIISFMLHISAITSPTNWYLYRWVSWNISEVFNETGQVHLIIGTTLRIPGLIKKKIMVRFFGHYLKQSRER